jgi:hypothetical protein
MNISQANLYEVLDAFQINAKVGGKVFEVKSPIHIDNGVVDVELRVEGLSIYETNTGLYAIMKIGDLGIVAIAKNAKFEKICLFDFAHGTAQHYLKSKDWEMLLTHLSESKWKPEFGIEVIEC